MHQPCAGGPWEQGMSCAWPSSAPASGSHLHPLPASLPTPTLFKGLPLARLSARWFLALSLLCTLCAAQGGDWSPALLPDLDVWLRPDSLASLPAGSSISVWPNSASSGTVYDAAPQFGRPPSVVASALNGAPALLFASTGTHGPGQSLTTPVNYHELQRYTIFLVYRFSDSPVRWERAVSSAGNPFVVGDWIWPSWNGWRDVLYEDPMGPVPGTGFGAYSASGRGAGPTPWMLTSLTFDGTVNMTARSHLNGAQTWLVTTNSAWPAPNGLRLGGGWVEPGFFDPNGEGSPTEYANVLFAEVLTLHAPASDSVRQQVEGYLAHKFDLQGGLPTSHPFRYAAPQLPTGSPTTTASPWEPPAPPAPPTSSAPSPARTS